MRGRALASSDSGLWVAGTERVLSLPGRDPHFSSSTLWSAKTRGGGDVVLKCFFDRAAFRTERTAYRMLSGHCAAVDHFLGEHCFDGAPVLVLRRLVPVNWTVDAWAPLLGRALAVRRSLSLARVQAPGRGGPIPTVGAEVLLAPLRAWVRGRADVPSAVSARTSGGYRPLPLELCHGDFHPPNLLQGSDDGLRLVDWERCAWSPPDRDLAAITVGTALRQPIEAFRPITDLARTHARDPVVFACLIMSEILALMEVFADDPGNSRVLSQMLDNFMNVIAEEWKR